MDLPVKGVKVVLNLKREGEVKQGSAMLMFNVKDLDLTKIYLESKNVQTTEIDDIPNIVSMFTIQDSEGNTI
ncbi:MAG: VOC family protein [Promethearchaeota archaeon]